MMSAYVVERRLNLSSSIWTPPIKKIIVESPAPLPDIVMELYERPAIWTPPVKEIITEVPDEIQAPAIRKLINKGIEDQPARQVKLWRHRPKIFLRDSFDVTLDDWQEHCAELYYSHQRMALVASKGPGKTFLLAMLGWHFFMCHYRPKMAALSVTKDHLKSNLWAELLMWRERSSLCTLSTNEGMERITLKGHEGYSFIDARSFPKSADQNTQASALAGLHSDNVAFLIDEAGTIPDAVLTTADAALTTAVTNSTNSKLIVTANPEVPAGLIYKAAMGKTVQKWAVHRISGDPDDPMRAPRVSIDWAREQIAQFGKDDPWVLVNVFGTYPDQAANMLLTDQEVHTAMNRDISNKDVQMAQTRAGLDVSRGGVDSSCFARRRGLKAYPIEKISSALKGAQLAGICMLQQQDHQIERLFVDDTGGYGSSVVDHLEMAAPLMDVMPIKYNASAQDKARYFNCRTEMWVRMRDWVRKGGQLPNDPELADQLTVPRLFFKGGIFRLEEKEQIKARLGHSPDKADALAQTFADVEQESFFADYSGQGNHAPAHTQEEQWQAYQRQGAGGDNHQSDPYALDSNTNPHYPRHSS